MEIRTLIKLTLTLILVLTLSGCASVKQALNDYDPINDPVAELVRESNRLGW